MASYNFLFLFLLLVHLYEVHCSQLAVLETSQLHSIQVVGICRAHCLDAFSSRLQIMQSIDNACIHEMSCHQCWENCGMMHNDYKTWGARMCAQESICFEGCQVACSVYRNLHQRGFQIDPPMQRRTFSTDLSMIRDTEGGSLSLFWSMPLPIYNEDIPSTSLPKCLYAVFWKQKELNHLQKPTVSDWLPLIQTYEMNYRTRHADLVSEAVDFLVLAITRDGIVAQQSLPDKNLTKLTREVENDKKAEKLQPNVYTSHVSNPGKAEPKRTSTTLFIIGVGFTGLICGLFLTMAVALTKVVIRSIRRRKGLSRGYAIRKELDIGHYLSKSMQLRTTPVHKDKHPGKSILRKMPSSGSIHPMENGEVKRSESDRQIHNKPMRYSPDGENYAENQVCPMPTPSLVAVHRSSSKVSTETTPISVPPSPLYYPSSQVYTSTPKAHVSFWTLKSPNTDGIGSGVVQYDQQTQDSLGASYCTARDYVTDRRYRSLDRDRGSYTFPRPDSDDYLLKIVHDHRTGKDRVKLRNPEELVNRLINQKSVQV